MNWNWKRFGTKLAVAVLVNVFAEWQLSKQQPFDKRHARHLYGASRSPTLTVRARTKAREELEAMLA